MHITYAITMGIHKQQCEDTARIGDMVINNDHGEADVPAPAIIALCDGVGGNAGGREASAFVCTNLSKDVTALNQQLIGYGKQLGKPAMATTLTALFFDADGVTLAYAGNTRLYTIRGGFINQVTTDQTTYEWLKSIGNMDGAEACNKSEIRCAMGGGNPDYLKALVMEPVFERKLPRMLMMTTDGIHDYVNQDEMEDILSSDTSAAEKCRRLVDRAVEHGSEDDCSVILIEI